MAGDNTALPDGFSLDAPPSSAASSSLPSGFTLDNAGTMASDWRKRTGAAPDVPTPFDSGLPQSIPSKDALDKAEDVSSAAGDALTSGLESQVAGVHILAGGLSGALGNQSDADANFQTAQQERADAAQLQAQAQGQSKGGATLGSVLSYVPAILTGGETAGGVIGGEQALNTATDAVDKGATSGQAEKAFFTGLPLDVAVNEIPGEIPGLGPVVGKLVGATAGAAGQAGSQAIQHAVSPDYIEAPNVQDAQKQAGINLLTAILTGGRAEEPQTTDPFLRNYEQSGAEQTSGPISPKALPAPDPTPSADEPQPPAPSPAPISTQGAQAAPITPGATVPVDATGTAYTTEQGGLTLAQAIDQGRGTSARLPAPVTTVDAQGNAIDSRTINDMLQDQQAQAQRKQDLGLTPDIEAAQQAHPGLPQEPVTELQELQPSDPEAPTPQPWWAAGQDAAEQHARAAGVATLKKEVPGAPEPLPANTPVDTSHDIPLGGGVAKDNSRIYLDQGLPKYLPVPKEDGSGDAMVDIEKDVPFHEAVEKPALDEGKDYGDAHSQNANSGEDGYLMAKYGVRRAAVDKALKPYLDTAAAKNPETSNIPDDLDRKPYEDGGDTDMLPELNNELSKIGIPEELHAQSKEFLGHVQEALNAGVSESDIREIAREPSMSYREKIYLINHLSDQHGPRNDLGDVDSWIVREKGTGKPVFETFNKRDLKNLNTDKYEAVPAIQHLRENNGAEAQSVQGSSNPLSSAKVGEAGDLSPQPPSPAASIGSANQGREQVPARQAPSIEGEAGTVRGSNTRVSDRTDQLENNASGESSASLEAQHRLSDEKEAGQTRAIIRRDGTVEPLTGVDAVDIHARSGEVVVQRGIGKEPWTILSHGDDLSRNVAAGKVNRAMSDLEDLNSGKASSNSEDQEEKSGDTYHLDLGGDYEDETNTENSESARKESHNPKASLSAVRRALADRGISDEAIKAMTPDQLRAEQANLRRRSEAPAPTQEEDLTSIKNASVAEERAMKGKAEVDYNVKRTNEQAYNEARSRIEADPQYGVKLAEELAANPRTHTPEEAAALVLDAVRIKNDINSAYESLQKARSNNDVGGETAARIRMRVLDAQYETNHLASKASGTEWSAAGRARQIELKDDYSMAALTRRGKEAAGDDLTASQREKLESLADAIAKREKAVAERENALRDARREPRSKQAQTQAKSKFDSLAEQLKAIAKKDQMKPGCVV